MTRRALLALLLAPCALAMAPQGPKGSTVRGRLVRQGQRGELYSAPGIKVRLTHPVHGQSTFVYTDMQGMYYWFDVPPGDFVLEVWLSEKYVLKYAVRVLARPFTDLPQIVVP